MEDTIRMSQREVKRVQAALPDVSDRLTKELRLAGISTLAAANPFLAAYRRSTTRALPWCPLRRPICIAPAPRPHRRVLLDEADLRTRSKRSRHWLSAADT